MLASRCRSEKRTDSTRCVQSRPSSEAGTQLPRYTRPEPVLASSNSIRFSLFVMTSVSFSFSFIRSFVRSFVRSQSIRQGRGLKQCIVDDFSDLCEGGGVGGRGGDDADPTHQRLCVLDVLLACAAAAAASSAVHVSLLHTLRFHSSGIYAFWGSIFTD